MTADASTHIVYRWPRARLVAVLGRIVMVLGALWVVATIAVAAWDLSDGWLLALGLVSLGVLAASGGPRPTPGADPGGRDDGGAIFLVGFAVDAPYGCGVL